MKALGCLALLVLGQLLSGQAGPVRFTSPQAAATGHHPPGGPGVTRPARVVRGWGWGGPWGWWSAEPARIIVQPVQPKEKEAPPYVTNKEYVPERLSPRLTEIAATPSLPARTEWRDCNVRLVGGERFDNARCAESDDMILVKAQSGRRFRFGRDLIDSLR